MLLAALWLFAICPIGLEATQASLLALDKRIRGLDNKLNSLLRQTVLTNLAIEETVRGEGDSGLKTVHLSYLGTKNYFKNALDSYRRYPASLILHPQNVASLTSTSMHASLNGVDFKSGSQSIQLQQPSTSSKAYMKTDYIPLPEVPSAVLQKKTVEEQTAEMVQWFRAFQTRKDKTRDYAKHFKPVLCYLEGWWENSDSLDSTGSGQKMAEAMARSGLSSGQYPSQAWPKQIWETTNGLKKAAWKSRILCQPIKTIANLRTNRFIPVDDLSVRMEHNLTYNEYVNSRWARFTMNQKDDYRFYDRSYRHGLLDKMMESIPGLDNHPANLRDTAFQSEAQRYFPDVPLNTGFYHRFYKVKRVGAMGTFSRHRGFTDGSVFMAQTSQPKVAGITLQDCKYVNRKRVCKSYSQKFTYAIPLMVTYLTPFRHWNPYNLPRYGQVKLNANGRTGRTNAATDAHLGYSYNWCFKIPSEFFESGAKGEPFSHVLSSGKVHRVGGCGHRTLIHPKGLSPIRLTFPIFSTNHEGTTVMKEVAALQDMLLDEAKYKSLW